jgi:hypothetical protein
MQTLTPDSPPRLSRQAQLVRLLQKNERDILKILADSPLDWTAYGLGEELHAPGKNMIRICEKFERERLIMQVGEIDGDPLYRMNHV